VKPEFTSEGGGSYPGKKTPSTSGRKKKKTKTTRKRPGAKHIKKKQEGYWCWKVSALCPRNPWGYVGKVGVGGITRVGVWGSVRLVVRKVKVVREKSKTTPK